MNRNSFFRLLWDQCRAVLCTLLLSDLVILFLLYLYRISLDLWGYYTLIILAAAVLYIVMKIFEIRRILLDLEVDDFDPSHYSPSAYPFLMKLQEYREKFQDVYNRSENSKRELEDYFSMWTHQTKLPIAAISLQLDAPDPDLGEIKTQIGRLQSYVGSAMAYIRLNSSSTDYEFREQDVDEIVREEIRAAASSFIRKGISIDFEGEHLMASTDRKWLAFVIGQILSNALKYSPSGSILHISTSQKSRELSIRDEGQGIPSQDLPRIFEKGFTGAHGRHSRESSGIGLYLCHEILSRLSHPFRIESEPGQGTDVIIRFPVEQTLFD